MIRQTDRRTDAIKSSGYSNYRNKFLTFSSISSGYSNYRNKFLTFSSKFFYVFVDPYLPLSSQVSHMLLLALVLVGGVWGVYGDAGAADVSMFAGGEDFALIMLRPALLCPNQVITDGRLTQFTPYPNIADVRFNLTRDAYKLHIQSEYRAMIKRIADGQLRVASDNNFAMAMRDITMLGKDVSFVTMDLRTVKDMVCFEIFANRVSMFCYVSSI